MDMLLLEHPSSSNRKLTSAPVSRPSTAETRESCLNSGPILQKLQSIRKCHGAHCTLKPKLPHLYNILHAIYHVIYTIYSIPDFLGAPGACGWDGFGLGAGTIPAWPHRIDDALRGLSRGLCILQLAYRT